MKMVKKCLCTFLAAVMLTSVASISAGSAYAAESSQTYDDEWKLLEEKLSTYGGEWTDNSYEGAITDAMPKTALLGNGDVGVVSYGKDNEKTYLISKGDFWNAGDLVTSSPFAANDLARRQIALGGLTIKGEGETVNKSLTVKDGVTATASAYHDSYYPSQVIDANMEFVDGSLEGWVSDVSKTSWLQIDLGQVEHIEKYIIYHHGSVMPDRAARNTKAYTVSFSQNGTDWDTVETVTDNKENKREFIFDEPIEARYMKIDITEPDSENSPSPRGRIAEVEIFADKNDISIFDNPNKSLTVRDGVTATASAYHDSYYPSQAIDANLDLDDGMSEGWVSNVSKTLWLQIDLGQVEHIEKYIIYHHGSVIPERAFRNTKAYTVSFSKDGTVWGTVETVTDNTENKREFVLEKAIEARYMKIDITEPDDGSDPSPRGRIAEVEIFANKDDVSIFDSNQENFKETQDIADPSITTEFEINGNPISVYNWLSATENIMVTEITSKSSEEINLDVSAWTKDDGSTNFKTESWAENGFVASSRSTYNAAKDNPDSWTSKAVIASKVIGDKEYEVKNNSNASSSLLFSLKPEETVYIVTSVGGGGQTYDNNDQLQMEEPKQEAVNILSEINTKEDIDSLKTAHQEWWKNYWLKSYIDIGDEDFHRYYYGSTYYMGASTREDTLASGLFGIWVTTDSSKYQGDYHLNYNYMAPYYGMYSSNRCETTYSALQPILDYVSKAEENAKTRLGELNSAYVSSRSDLADGIDGGVLFPVGLGPWGTYTENTFFNQSLNGLFAASQFISYYNYTGDDEFLVNTAYPFLEKVATFYEQWCEKEDLGDGNYQYNLYDGEHEGVFHKNAGVSIGMAKNVFQFLIRNSDKLDVSQEKVDKWIDMDTHMADVPVRNYVNGNFDKPVFALSEDGDIIWPGSATVNLEFVHPGEQLSFDSDPEMLEIGRNTVEAKIVANPDNWSCINNNPKIFVQAIRLGCDPAYIMKNFKTSNIDVMEQNFTIQDNNHGIEKAGAIEFINNMLLQSSYGTIKVFPNWTGDDASFTRLREKGAFLVSSEMTQGNVEFVNITSEKGNDVKIVNPWGELPVKIVDEQGNPVAYKTGSTLNTGEQTIEFATESNKTYKITASSYSIGDVNHDETIDIDDVTEIQKYIVGIENSGTFDVALADVNGDKKITIADASCVQIMLISKKEN